jgi:hypothetical protein
LKTWAAVNWNSFICSWWKHCTDTWPVMHLTSVHLNYYYYVVFSLVTACVEQCSIILLKDKVKPAEISNRLFFHVQLWV